VKAVSSVTLREKVASRGVLQYTPTMMDSCSLIRSKAGFVRNNILGNYKN